MNTVANLLFGLAAAVAPLELVAQDGDVNRTEVCTAVEISRAPLDLGNKTLAYIEVLAFVADSRGDVLLAGSPTYLSRFDPHGAQIALAEDSIFGAVIPQTGNARAVPLPIKGLKARPIRAVARPGGGWEIVFAQVKSGRKDTQASDSVTRLWYGTYDGLRWGPLEELPLPSEGAIRPIFASSLLRHGDTLSWATTLDPRTGSQGIVLFQRRGLRWSYEIVPTFHSQVELAHSDTRGLLLLVVQPDSATRQSDANSFFLWSRSPEWKKLRRLVHGSRDGRVYTPSAVLTDSAGAISWDAPVRTGNRGRQEVRAMVGNVVARNEPVIAVDSSVAGFNNISGPFAVGNQSHLWVTGHLPSSGRETQLRFTTVSDGSATVLRSVASPYTGFIAAAVSGPHDLLLTGLQYVPNRYLVSVLIRSRVECRGGRVRRGSRAKAQTQP